MKLEKTTNTLSNKWAQEFSSIESNNFKSIIHHYHSQESTFKKKINKLNLNCHINIDKYQTSRFNYESSMDQLIDSLFKQVTVYIEEIDRLNNLLQEKSNKETIPVVVSSIILAYLFFFNPFYLEYDK